MCLISRLKANNQQSVSLPLAHTLSPSPSHTQVRCVVNAVCKFLPLCAQVIYQ